MLKILLLQRTYHHLYNIFGNQGAFLRKAYEFHSIYMNHGFDLRLVFVCSFDQSLSIEEREKRIRQAAGRSSFVQDLFLSTLLGD